jgi:hypothetical protein
MVEAVAARFAATTQSCCSTHRSIVVNGNNQGSLERVDPSRAHVGKEIVHVDDVGLKVS